MYPKIYVQLEPQITTLFGKRVSAGLIKARVKMRSNWIRVGPKPNESVFVGDRKDTQRCGEAADVKMEAEIGVMHP